ncbi:hypothetical protein [Oceaniglobus roseus]|uniref:hypothetical protein n=1 Tax=Oceaniglobus roseus TaxID=1737570 RepID=UPI001561B7A1|nr:hypothetical protein [Kandeliimicrobium roseum]
MITLKKAGLAAAILTAFALATPPLAAQAVQKSAPFGFDLSRDGAQILQVRRGRGADDGAGHDAGDDKGGRRGGKGRGADDARGDDRGGRDGGKGRGGDDGANHT